MKAARCAGLQGAAFSPPRRAGLAPRKTAEQAVPDRPAHHTDCALRALLPSSQACLRHAKALAARRWFVASLAVGRSSVFPLLHRWSRDRSRRCLAVKARRAVYSPAAAGRTNPARVSLTASPRRPGCSRAMNSGKTAATAISPGHCAEPTEANTGLRILESGRFCKPQEAAHADTDTVNHERVFVLPFLLSPHWSTHHAHRYPSRNASPARSQRRRCGTRPAADSAVAVAAFEPQRAQERRHVDSRTGIEHRPRRPAAKPHRHRSERWRALRSGRRQAAAGRVEAAGEATQARQDP